MNESNFLPMSAARQRSGAVPSRRVFHQEAKGGDHDDGLPSHPAERGRGRGALREAIPDVIKGYGALSAGTYKQGALDPKTKELIALALAIGARCDGCVAYHAKAAHDKGASREEVAEVIGVAIHMGGGPSMVYGAEALRAFDAFSGARTTDGGPSHEARP